MRGWRTPGSVFCGALAVTAALLVPATGAGLGQEPANTQRAVVDDAEIMKALERMPLAFEPNHGQTDPSVRFLARTRDSALFLTDEEAVLRVGKRDEVVRMRLVGGSAAAETEGLEPLRGVVNYYGGADASKWRAGIPTYAKVAYRGVYPGVDVVYYGTGGQVEYDFVVAPGADPAAVRLGFEGQEGLRIDRRGDLVLDVSGGEVRHRRPVAYQEGPGGRRRVPARFVLNDGEVGFDVSRYDRSRTLVIDPLVYSSFLGGTAYDTGLGISVDQGGNAIVAGYTESSDFPTLNAVDTDDPASDDAFVTKFNAAGSALVYSTYLSGNPPASTNDTDQAHDVAVDGGGNAYVTGVASQFFPTTSGAFKSCSDDLGDAFVTKLTAAGALGYSTCVGGSGYDQGLDITVDPSANAYLVGHTSSADFPIAAAVQPSLNQGSGTAKDGFVVKLNATGSGLAWSTYYGGSQVDLAQGVALHQSGVYVAGTTGSTNLLLAGSPYQGANRGAADVFVAKFSLSGSLAWSTYLGGTNMDGQPAALSMGLAVDGSGRPHVASSTYSTDFPTTAGVLQRTHKGGSRDFFVTKLNASGSGLVYSTYLGGSGDDGLDVGVGLALDGSGSAYLNGTTNSSDLPLVNHVQGYGGSWEAYIAKLNALGSGFAYATYLGGLGLENGLGGDITVDPDGNAYATGKADSLNFPVTSGAYQTTPAFDLSDPGKAGDAYATKFDPLLGFLRITTSPSLPSQVTVDGVPRTTWGTINLEAAPGTHQVCFRDVEGFTNPGCQNVTVNNGAATQVAGSFVQRGFLQVVTNPALPAKITVGDYVRDDWGIYTDLPVGTYRVCFGPVKDYSPPSCQDATVTAGTTATVTGNYTLSVGAPGEPAGNGALRVTTNPALPSQISVDGVPRATWGLINLQLAPGAHTVCFRDVEGFVTPACRTVSVTAGATTVTQGDFVAKGFLQVVTSPALPAAIYVNNVARDDWGLYTDYPVGTYEVCFGAVWGYRTPPCQTVSVTAGTTTTVTGTFSSA